MLRAVTLRNLLPSRDFVHDKHTLEPEQLTQRPSLKRATSWSVRLFGVSQLAHVTEAGVLELASPRQHEAFTRQRFGLRGTSAHFHPRLDERAEQPRPDS